MSQIEILKWTPKESGVLKGFANVSLPKMGIEIYGVKYFQKGSQKWIRMPSNAIEKDGETKYYPHVRFKEKEVMEKFSKACIEEIDNFRSTSQSTTNYNDLDIPF